MNTLNAVHYAIEIDTLTTITDESIGLYAGKMRYITDGYAPEGTANYEDLSPVVGVWNSDLLQKNGISQSSQSIDISAGGDYAFAAELNVSLINVDQLHKKIAQTTGISIVGKPAQMWVIVDDIFYSRFCGSVSEIGFSDRKFTITMKDKNNSDLSTVENYQFGYYYVTAEASTTKEAVYGGIPVSFCRVLYDTPRAYRGAPYHGGARYYEELERFMENEFCGKTLEPTVSLSQSTGVLYEIHLAGNLPNIEAGMVAKFSTDTEEMSIISAENYVFSIGSGGNIYKCKIIVNRFPDGVIDFAQFYGLQPLNVEYLFPPTNAEIHDVTARLNAPDTKKVFVDIFQSTNKVVVPAGSAPVIENGKIKAITREGEPVFVNAVTNADGSYSVTSGKVYKTIKPSSFVRTAPLIRADLDSLDAGTFTGYDELDWAFLYPTNNFASNDSDFAPILDRSSAHIVEFETSEQTKGYTPAIIIRMPVSGTMSFASVSTSYKPDQTTQVLHTFIGSASTLSSNAGLISKTVNGSYGSDDEMLHSIAFPEFEVGIYRPYTTGEFGTNIEYESSFYVPNVPLMRGKRRGSTWSEAGVIDVEYTPDPYPCIFHQVTFQAGGIPATNAPAKMISGEVVSTSFGEIVNFYKTRTLAGIAPVRDYDYPNGKIDYDTPTESTGGAKTVFVIRQSKPDEQGSDGKFFWVGGIYSNGVNTNTNEVEFITLDVDTGRSVFRPEIATVGYYKEETLDIQTLKFCMVKTGLSNVSAMLSDITGLAVNLPNRTNWVTGCNIPEKTNKFSIVTNLCKQSFVAGFTDRSGNPSFVEIDDLERAKAIHNSTGIIRGSIDNFANTPIEKCYNDFAITYGNSKKISVSKVDDYAIPLPTYDWQGHVYGVPDYNDAKTMWENARKSYLANGRTRQAPADRSALKYAVDLNEYFNSTEYDETAGYGRSYTDLFIWWSTRQKYTVQYVLPMTAANVKLNLLDMVNFSDAIITPEAGEAGTGWVTSIKCDTSKDQIKLGVTFETGFFLPLALAELGDIVETGYSTTNIIESGTNTDNIIEGQ